MSQVQSYVPSFGFSPYGDQGLLSAAQGLSEQKSSSRQEGGLTRRKSLREKPNPKETDLDQESKELERKKKEQDVALLRLQVEANDLKLREQQTQLIKRSQTQSSKPSASSRPTSGRTPRPVPVVVPSSQPSIITATVAHAQKTGDPLSTTTEAKTDATQPSPAAVPGAAPDVPSVPTPSVPGYPQLVYPQTPGAPFPWYFTVPPGGFPQPYPTVYAQAPAANVSTPESEPQDESDGTAREHPEGSDGTHLARTIERDDAVLDERKRRRSDRRPNNKIKEVWDILDAAEKQQDKYFAELADLTAEEVKKKLDAMPFYPDAINYFSDLLASDREYIARLEKTLDDQNAYVHTSLKNQEKLANFMGATAGQVEDLRGRLKSSERSYDRAKFKELSDKYLNSLAVAIARVNGIADNLDKIDGKDVVEALKSAGVAEKIKAAAQQDFQKKLDEHREDYTQKLAKAQSEIAQKDDQRKTELSALIARHDEARRTLDVQRQREIAQIHLDHEKQRLKLDERHRANLERLRAQHQNKSRALADRAITLARTNPEITVDDLLIDDDYDNSSKPATLPQKNTPSQNKSGWREPVAVNHLDEKEEGATTSVINEHEEEDNEGDTTTDEKKNEGATTSAINLDEDEWDDDYDEKEETERLPIEDLPDI